MGKIQTFIHLWKTNPKGIKIAIFDNMTHIGIFKFLNDETFLQLAFRIKMGQTLNLHTPKTYNEKIQWLKLYDRRPAYTMYVDKYRVREYIIEKIGEQYLIPLLGVWDNPDKINFDELPDKFVLKCNHDSGSVIICKNKNKINAKQVKKHFKRALSKNLYNWCREWPYKDVKPCIIAEKYMEDSKLKELRDYKFFCFNGKVKALFIAEDRHAPMEETKFDFFDKDFNHLDIINGHPNANKSPEKPQNYELMISLAEKLSENIPHVRVDFYEVNGKVYFGEMTFSHWSGMVPFEPEEWDYKFGDWLVLPSNEIN